MGLYVGCGGVRVLVLDGGVVGSTRTSVMDPAITTRSPLTLLYNVVLVLGRILNDDFDFTVGLYIFGDKGGDLYEDVITTN